MGFGLDVVARAFHPDIYQNVLEHNVGHILLMTCLAVPVLVHIVIASFSAMLPGRMVLRMLMTMKKEMESKKTFVRYISHEIRSPLSSVSLGLDHLILSLTSGKMHSIDDILEVVRDAKVAADIATSTLNDLLMFDKIETGMLEINTAECNMHEFITSCVKPFSLQAASDKIALTHTFTDARLKISSRDEYDVERGTAIQRGVLVKIDKYKMQQVVRNFLTNALKFTPEGGSVAVNVTLKDGRPPSEKNKYVTSGPPVVRVEVVDSGPGISAENLPKLFGQYVQFDANTLQGGKGSGLGLWLSKAIVEMHDGVIGASSEGAGQGSSFFFEIDVCQLCCDDDNSLDCSTHRVHLSYTPSPHSPPGSGPPHTSPPITRRKSHEVKVFMRTSSDDPPSPHTTNPRMMSTDLFTVTESFLEPEEGATNETRHNSVRQLSSLREDMRPGSPLVVISKKTKQYQILVNQLPEYDLQQIGQSLNSSGGISLRVSTKDAMSPTSVKQISPTSNTMMSPKTRISVNDIRVLLVDDSAIARKMVERTLTSIDGCVCMHAVNGQDAVQKVAESMLVDGAGEVTTFDVILMDYYMPVMSGPEAVNLIRGQGYRGVILALTGASSDTEFSALLGQGVDRILVKPFNLDEFKRAYREVKRANMLDDAVADM
eukprot:gene30700-37954_t